VIWSLSGKGRSAATDYFAWRACTKVVNATDTVGAVELRKAGKLVTLPHLTPILILDTVPETDSTPMAGLEIRVMGGEYDRLRLWVAESGAARLVPKAPEPPKPTPKAKPRPKPKSPTYKPGMPSQAASQAYRDARKLETEGKLPEAIEAYRALSQSIFPERKLAADRLKVLTGK
jgi:hypothetical protein